MIATVGSLRGLDPMVGYLNGEQAFEKVGQVDVQMRLAGQDQFGVAEAAWECGSWGWRIEESVGVPDELRELLDQLTPVLDC